MSALNASKLAEPTTDHQSLLAGLVGLPQAPDNRAVAPRAGNVRLGSQPPTSEKGPAAMDPTPSPTGYKVSDTAPNMIAYDQDDHAAPLYRFAQQALLLDFCAMWCGPCQRMAPSVTPVTQTLRNAGIAFTYLPVLLQGRNGLPATADDARLWANRYGITTPVLHPRGEADSQAWQQFLDYAASNGLEVAFPTLVFLDSDRRVQKVNAGFMSADDIQHQFDPNLPFLADAAAP